MELEDVIGGQVASKFLEDFLDAYPESFHPYDIERCDKFIVALFRYRPNIDLYNLEILLKERFWEEQNIEWFIARIKVGLNILKVNRNFRKTAALNKLDQ
ncbi:hypothetical protein [Marinoscillum sp. MHG1-6]|uniref:hypothetical protein n=1 Tax=Marinoscillum sp. MHG1-6 TaxID=2959627 RepID=UPI0021580ED7|nr:hypothetical protein [Marinoscillum sp. MHG1-6]